MKQLFILVFFSLTLSSFAGTRVIDSIESVGEQKTAIIFIDLLEDGKEPSIELYEEAILGEGKSVNNFVKEVSHGKTWLKGQTYPWLRLKNTGKTCYLSGEEILNAVIKENLFDVHEVDRLLVFNHLAYEGECLKKNSFGFSTLGKENFNTSKGQVRLSLAQFWAGHRFVLPKLPHQPLSGISSSVIAHEIGHSFGLRGHSNLLECGKDPLSFNRPDCTQSAIADMFSLMAGEGFYRPSLHYSACHKADLGWINEKDDSLVILNKGKVERKVVVKLHPYTSVSGNISVKINLDSPIPVPCVNPNNCNVSIQSLFLEYRTANGFDENIAKLKNESGRYFDQIVLDPEFYGSSKEINTNGIQIRGGFYKDDYCVTSYNLDLTPDSIHARNRLTGEVNSYSLYDNLDSFLTAGKTFEEPVNGLKVSVLEIDEEGNAVVEIKY